MKYGSSADTASAGSYEFGIGSLSRLREREGVRVLFSAYLIGKNLGDAVSLKIVCDANLKALKILSEMAEFIIDRIVEKQFMYWLYKQYIRRFGYGVRNIDKCNFWTTCNIKDLPCEFYEVQNGVAVSHVVEYAKELEAKGLVRFAENGHEFYFTKQGYEAVSASCWQMFLSFLNKNPSLLSLSALIVSFGSLIVAILAYFKE